MAKLISSKDLKHLHVKTNKNGFMSLIVTLLIISILSYLVLTVNNLWLVVFLELFLGFIFAGFFSVIHYCSHDTFFADKFLNRIFGPFFSSLILMNFSVYKYFHLQHHKYTGVEGDSEPAGEIPTIKHYFFYLLNWDYIFAFMRMSLASIFGYFPFFIKSDLAKKNIVIDTCFQLLVLVFIIFLTLKLPKELLLLYWLPLQLGLITNFILVIGEHYGCDQSGDNLVNTRSFAKQGLLFNFFHYYSNYHAEHHLYPYVAPWKLPLVHLKVKEKLKYKNMPYIKFNIEIIKNLFLQNKPVVKLVSKERESSFFYALSKYSGKEVL